jgi:hypothetical protein
MTHYNILVGVDSRDMVMLFGRSFLAVKDSHPDKAMLFIKSLLNAIITYDYYWSSYLCPHWTNA